MNGKEFNFRSVPERSCTLFELPRGADKNGDGRKLANITEKIQVKVNYALFFYSRLFGFSCFSVLQLIF